MKVTNTSEGPRGINTAAGPVLLEPGETRDLDVSAAEAKIARATGWFEMAGAAATTPKQAAGAEDDAGKKAADLLAKEKAGGMHFKTFEAEAKDILGDATPSTKDEIVKALEGLATKP